MKVTLSTWLLTLAPLFLMAQSKLVNPSFEGSPQDATVPTGWMPCEPGSTPDIMPGPWGVFQEPSEGASYIGLITREDGTFESIGQRLSTSLDKGECYSMSVDLARSPTYTGYSRPLRIRVWGAVNRCQKSTLFYESPLINHAEWETYKFSFITKSKCNYIIIEAYHKEGGRNYKGNILLDNCSRIVKCNRA